jgi:hypothetical protein
MGELSSEEFFLEDFLPTAGIGSRGKGAARIDGAWASARVVRLAAQGSAVAKIAEFFSGGTNCMTVFFGFPDLIRMSNLNKYLVAVSLLV